MEGWRSEERRVRLPWGPGRAVWAGITVWAGPPGADTPGCVWDVMAGFGTERPLAPAHFAFCAVTWPPLRTAGRGHRETLGLRFEQEPGLDSGTGGRPRASPHWPLINESCRRASTLPPSPPAGRWAGRGSPGRSPQSPGWLWL